MTSQLTEQMPAGLRVLAVADLEEAAEARTERAGAYCLECACHSSALCETHATDLDAAEEYRIAAQELRTEAEAD